MAFPGLLFQYYFTLLIGLLTPVTTGFWGPPSGGVKCSESRPILRPSWISSDCGFLRAIRWEPVETPNGEDNIPHTIHVWYIYLHLVDFYGKCREIYHTWIVWVLASWKIPSLTSIFFKWVGSNHQPARVSIELSKPVPFWTHVKPLFLGPRLISLLHFGFKTFIFPWVFGVQG